MIYFIADKIFGQITSYYRMAPVGCGYPLYEGAGNKLLRDDGGAERLLARAGRMLDARPPNKDDILAVVRSDAGVIDRARGDVIMLNALVGSGRGKTFYPDMLFKHPFAETSGGYDYCVPFAARFKHHNVYFFIVTGTAEPLLRWLDARASFICGPDAAALTDDEAQLAERLITNLRMTETMRREFADLVDKYKRRHNGIDILNEYTGGVYANKLQARRAYAALKQLLLE